MMNKQSCETEEIIVGTENKTILTIYTFVVLVERDTTAGWPSGLRRWF